MLSDNYTIQSTVVAHIYHIKLQRCKVTIKQFNQQLDAVPSEDVELEIYKFQMKNSEDPKERETAARKIHSIQMVSKIKYLNFYNLAVIISCNEAI